MANKLEDLRKTLIEGIRLSKQSSYGRRASAPEALPSLTEARRGLRAFVDASPDNAEAWNLLSQAEECLLHYPDARKCLERAMSISGNRTKGDLKRLALYKQMEQSWGKLLLTPLQLRQLGLYLREKLADEPCERTFKWTENWLRENGVENTREVVESIRATGTFDDFQVAENLARG